MLFRNLLKGFLFKKMYKTLEHNSSSLESIARSSRAFIRSFRLCLGGRFFFPSLGLGVPARLEEAVDYALVFVSQSQKNLSVQH